jgi:uracil phosphoribosyltransferase
MMNGTFELSFLTAGMRILRWRVLATMQKWGVSKIKMLSVIAAPEGVERLTKEFPEIEIHTCALDEKLNDKKFIVPGLGDAGDRIFNTIV